jgi:DNA-directed RNA polymerase subunit beta
MSKDKYYGKTLRKNFARYEEVMPVPNLLEIQKKSYQWFWEEGLREVFADVGSIADYQGNLELTFIDYKMDEAPKYNVEECKARDATYAAPLKVTVRLRNKETEEIKEQEIFMGDFPLMTHGGTFVINGAERVVVSQIVRSPGVYYGKEIDLKTDLPILSATVIPYRGAWLEYETDANECFWVRIDKNRKLPVTCLLRSLGMKTDAEILARFGDDPRILATLEKDPCKTYEEAMLEIYRKLRPGEPPTVEACVTLMNNLFLIPGATICPSWVGISSIKSCVCGPGWPDTSWPCPWQTPLPEKSCLRTATCSPWRRPSGWTPAASARSASSPTASL